MSFNFWNYNFIFGTRRGDTLPGSLNPDWVFARAGDDIISTGQRNDRVFGGQGNDNIDGGADDDSLFGGRGNDDITGGEGNDYIDGGRGFDTAHYSGSINEYTIETSGGWWLPTTALTRTDDSGKIIERDTLRGIEAVRFEADDYTFYLDGRNNAVLAADDAVTTDEDSVLTFDAADLTANDQDFDGDAITVTGVDTVSTAGAAVSLINGEISYDPGALFDALAQGETAEDTFSYTVDDGRGGTATATVTVVINGADDIVPANARINEFHYDNAGTDSGEFIEIRSDAGSDASDLLIELYNGSNGSIYNSFNISAFTMTSDGTYDYYVLDLPTNGLQNGSPDGIALSQGGTLIEFLSYEGSFDGVGGSADGVTSTDIGVSESGSTPLGQSVQRDADGDFQAPAAETKGGANDTSTGGGDPESLLISEIQGSGTASMRTGEFVVVSAIVTYTVSNGFFLQEEDADADADDQTSEGIFVFTGGTPSVAVGDLVEATGTVAEFSGSTQISGVTDLVTVNSGQMLPTPATLFLSPDMASDLERYENMRISVGSGTDEALTVIENFNLDRFGEITISAGTQTQPTQLFDAQSEAAQISALQQANANNRLLIDDAVSGQNPTAFGYVPASAGDNGNGFLDADDTFGDTGPTLRLGSEIAGTVNGVLAFGFGDYRVFVDGTLNIDEGTNGGARPVSPDDTGGDLKVASFNVLNYFTTLDTPANQGSVGPNLLDPRGASSAGDLARQTDKIVNALLEIDADVVGLQELENNGFGPGSAIATLVAALNEEATMRGEDATYAFVDPTNGDPEGFIGTDAITTGIIYRTSDVTLDNADFLPFVEQSAADTFALAEILNPFASADDQLGDFQRSRPAVAATFTENKPDGETFTLAVNHFKSKGDSNLEDLVFDVQAALANGDVPAGQLAAVEQALADLLVDPNYDQGDGQGFWNQARADAATEIVAWLETDYAPGLTDPDYLIIGDLNAYAEEDPVQAIRDDAGYSDLIDTYIGQDEAYSFVFDGQQGSLDHGLSSQSLALQVTGATEWHINADEPDLLNYSSQFNDARFYNDDVFAASDHDPLIIGLDLGSAPDPLLV